MIVDLPNTGTREISKQLVRLRHQMGAVTLGRVLTLVVDVDENRAEEAVETASEATRQAPSRILVVARGNARGATRLDAQIRLGGDAGASEIVVLRLHGKLVEHGRSVCIPLLLADSPIVVWWPGEAPEDVATSPLGSMAQRRVTDAQEARRPRRALDVRAKTYRPGDTDLSWARLTRWRGLLAASLDNAPYQSVTAATVTGATDSASADLLAAWLQVQLKCPVVRARSRVGTGVVSVRLERASGPIDLVSTSPTLAVLSQPGHPTRRLTLVEPTISSALAEELRRLDPDEVYETALIKGLAEIVTRKGPTQSEAVAGDEAPDVETAKRAGESARRRGVATSSAKLEQADTPDSGPTEQVQQAAREKLGDKLEETGKPKAAQAARAKGSSRSAGRSTTKSAAKKKPASTEKSAAATEAPAAESAPATQAPSADRAEPSTDGAS